MKKTIEAYSLSEFVQKIQAEVKSGWEIDFGDNDSIPHGGMGFYSCMVGRGQGKQIPVLFLAPQTEPSKSFELVANLTAPEGFSEHREPFTPTVMFTTDKPISEPRKAGRPRASTI
jgi:hypothetical protein